VVAGGTEAEKTPVQMVIVDIPSNGTLSVCIFGEHLLQRDIEPNKTAITNAAGKRFIIASIIP
jgi:hypothetical protein